MFPNKEQIRGRRKSIAEEIVPGQAAGEHEHVREEHLVTDGGFLGGNSIGFF